MTSAEFAEWMSYAEQFGLPDPIEQAALICCTLANVNGDKSKPSDFMPKQESEQSLDDVAKQLKARSRAVS